MPISTSVVAGFMDVFAGMSRAYGVYSVSKQRADGKKVGSAITVRKPVTLELWQAHLDGTASLGIIPIREDSTCLFGAIDVDEYVDVSHADIADRIDRLGLPLTVCRSKSGGAHIYCFSRSPVSAKDMQTKLKEAAAVLGFGGSEIFPKQTSILAESGDVGQWINMPYFGGDRTIRYAVDSRGNAMSVESFLQRVAELAVEDKWFESELVSESYFSDGPPCLQVLASQGFPEGTRNNGLYAIGVYLQKKFPDNWEAELGIHNNQFMDPPLTPQEVVGLSKSLKKREYNYKCSDQPLASCCNSAMCRIRKYGVGSGGSTFPELGSLSKLCVEPPIWFWDVDSRRIELTTPELQEPRHFQRKCMETLNMMPTLPTKAVWQSLVQNAMESVIEIPAPVDASVVGQFLEMVEQFCTGRAQARAREEIRLGKPFTEGGRTYFRLRDLISFLERNKFTAFGPPKIAAILRDHGAKHHEGRLKNVFTNYWSMAAFDSPSSDFEVPSDVGDDGPPF